MATHIDSATIALFTVAYDANGNTLTDAQGRSFTWDFENRLMQVVNPGVGTTTFRYDPFGRRIQKSGPLGTTNFLYDDRWENVIEEVDNNGVVVARYEHDLGLDSPLSEFRSGAASYYEQEGRVARAFDLVDTTTTVGCPALRVLCEGRVPDCRHRGVFAQRHFQATDRETKFPSIPHSLAPIPPPPTDRTDNCSISIAPANTPVPV